MTYSIDRILEGISLDDAESKVRQALADKGFGVLTEIDVQATMKKKLDVDVAGYKILGACNPQLALKAMTAEPKIGVMLPCNVIIRQVEAGIEVSAVDPIASMNAINNPDLITIATDVKRLLGEVVASL